MMYASRRQRGRAWNENPPATTGSYSLMAALERDRYTSWRAAA
jgi:hypothetical protein